MECDLLDLLHLREVAKDNRAAVNERLKVRHPAPATRMTCAQRTARAELNQFTPHDALILNNDLTVSHRTFYDVKRTY